MGLLEVVRVRVRVRVRVSTRVCVYRSSNQHPYLLASKILL